MNIFAQSTLAGLILLAGQSLWSCPQINAQYEACVPAENEEETLTPMAISTSVILGVPTYSFNLLTPIGLPSSIPTIQMIADSQWRNEQNTVTSDIVRARISCEDNKIVRHQQVLDGNTKSVKSNTISVYSLISNKGTLLFKLMATGPDINNDVLYTQADAYCIKK